VTPTPTLPPWGREDEEFVGEPPTQETGAPPP